MTDWIKRFVEESNRIEDIHETTDQEIDIHLLFILSDGQISDLEDLVSVCQPDAKLRREHGMDVQVGSWMAPSGGPLIEPALQQILDTGDDQPYRQHLRYETLHPFTDCNGRSGRALWLRSMLNLVGHNATMAKNLGFLHTFYYQTLENNDR